MVSKLLINAKTEESVSNQILNYIHVIVIVFKCIRAYARDYTLVSIIEDHEWVDEDFALLLHESHIFYIGEIRHSLLTYFIIDENMLVGS